MLKTEAQSYLEAFTSTSSETALVLLGVLSQSYLKDILLYSWEGIHDR